MGTGLKIGFLIIILFFSVLLMNNLPSSFDQFQNYIVLAILLFVGGIFIIAMKK